MRHFKFCLKLSALILSVYFLTTVRASGPGSTKLKKGNIATPEGIVPDKIVIKFKSNSQLGKSAAASGISSVDALLQKNNIVQLEQVIGRFENLRANASHNGMESIYYAPIFGSSPTDAAAELSQDPAVEYAEPLYYHELHVTPNDTLFSRQSHFIPVNMQQAWDIVRGEQGDVIIAIVDGGTDIDHPDIVPNLWSNPGEADGNGIDDDGNGFVDDVHGWNFANDTPDPSGLPSTPFNGNHGTHTAGIACARTNNITGVAGSSWNAMLMAINAGSPTEDQTILTGYEGILYAVENGADVISLSWGRVGPLSQFEQDVINFATENGTTVVASAGNANNSLRNYPAAYDNVLGVGATLNSGTKSNFSNFGSWVDISAPGSGIFSTFDNGGYGLLSGTSMSTPLVAGVLGLVRTANPQLDAVQVAELVRVTADDINAQNPSHANLLGKGRLNALRALSENPPSVRVTEVQILDENGDDIIQKGETIEVLATLKNFLAPVSNLNLTLSESDDFAFIIDGDVSVGSLGRGEEISLSVPFRFSTEENTPSGHPIVFMLQISGNAYEDFDFFTLTVLPTFGTANINNIDVTVTNVGRIGFADPNNSASGIGFTFQNGPNLLFDGGLIAGIGAEQIANAARGIPGTYDDDFSIAPSGDLKVFTPGAQTAQETIGIFRDSQASTPMNVQITQQTFAEAAAPNDDFILLKYVIENIGDENLSNFHFGIFFDWDIDENTLQTNLADYDPTRRLGYSYDSGNGPGIYVGTAVFTGGGVHYRAIYNDLSAGSQPWAVNDGFTDSEKWQAISGGIEFTNAGPADVSFTIASGPFEIPQNERIIIGFGLLGGTDLADLQQNADAAKALWQSLELDEGTIPLPIEFALRQNYPNPFNSGTVIEYDLPEAGNVRLEIFNVLGQRVRMLINNAQTVGVHPQRWDTRDDDGRLLPSGVYIFRLVAGDFVSSRKMLLVR